MAAADFIKSLVPGAQNVYKNIMFSPALSLLKDVLKVGTAQWIGAKAHNLLA